jgi:hypothetical protein
MMPGQQLVVPAPRGAKRAAETLRLEPVHATHPARAGFEAFIAARFRLAYRARLTRFLPHLLGVRDRLAGWRAGAGYAAAAADTLFLERYLDVPVERAIHAAGGPLPARSGIVEVGNLASISAGMARELIPALALHFHRLGYAWVTFTATRALRNSFHRLGLRPLRLASADAARLEDGGASWGSYYAQDPVVVACEIEQGLRAWGYA